MTKYKLTIHIEKEIDAADEDDAVARFYQTTEESNNSLEDEVARALTITKI